MISKQNIYLDISLISLCGSCNQMEGCRCCEVTVPRSIRSRPRLCKMNAVNQDPVKQRSREAPELKLSEHLELTQVIGMNLV